MNKELLHNLRSQYQSEIGNIKQEIKAHLSNVNENMQPEVLRYIQYDFLKAKISQISKYKSEIGVIDDILNDTPKKQMLHG